MTEASSPEAPRAGRHRWLRRALLLLLGAAVVVLSWSAFALLGARSDLTRARADLQVLSGEGTPSTEQVQASLTTASARLRSAEDRLTAPGPALLATVPVAGRWVEGPLAVTRAGLAVSTASQRVLDVWAGNDEIVRDGAVDLPLLAQLQQALADAARTTQQPVQQLAEVRTGLTPPALRDGVVQARDLLAPLPETLRKASHALAALHGVLGGRGSRKVLIVLANNAEQRGAGGLVSVFAQGTARDGRLELSAFRDVADVADLPGQARRVPSPADYHALWGRYLADTTLWRNATMSPDGPSSLAVMAALSRASTEQSADVVICLDVRAISRVLAATGPAPFALGGDLTAQNAVERLLLTAYSAFPDDAKGQFQRRQVLRSAADTVVDALLQGRADPLSLVRELAGAVAGRHLVLWSARPGEQAALAAAGAAGAVRAGPGDIASAITQNFGQAAGEGNKLDYFARRLHQVDVTVGLTSAHVVQQVEIRNNAPARRLPGYVVGYTDPGRLDALLTFAVPTAATGMRFERDGSELPVGLSPERDHQLLTDTMQLHRGQSARWKITYDVPVRDAAYTLALVPQALAVDAGLSVVVRPTGGVDLALPAGSPLERADHGVVRLVGPFDRAVALRVDVHRPGRATRLVRRLRRFWNEPVRL